MTRIAPVIRVKMPVEMHEFTRIATPRFKVSCFWCRIFAVKSVGVYPDWNFYSDRASEGLGASRHHEEAFQPLKPSQTSQYTEGFKRNPLSQAGRERRQLLSPRGATADVFFQSEVLINEGKKTELGIFLLLLRERETETSRGFIMVHTPLPETPL